MASKKEKIVPETLVGASEEQSNQQINTDIITEFEEEFNPTIIFVKCNFKCYPAI